MHAAFSPPAADAVPIYLLDAAGWAAGAPETPEAVRAFADALRFDAAAGQIVLAPDATGRGLGGVVYGLGEGGDALALAGLAAQAPPGVYEIASSPKDWPIERAAAGWADGAYRFQKYMSDTHSPPRLVLPDGVDEAAASREAAAVDFVRDLVNTPAEDMGPDGLEAAARELADLYGAEVAVTTGDALLEANYPMVHAVGRAGARPPRFVELSWGRPGAPELALVGKGVCFDTGGLNLKTGNYMRDMKKDMGGAAHALGLARLVMDAELPVHLKLYVPAVENAVSGNAFRPGDVLPTRKGLHVEIDNTDAEGRLVLADALARACESSPNLILDFATLTGAARVALGPDLAPFYTADETVAAAMAAGGAAAGDPVWRMPLWEPYYAELKSSVADMVNAAGPLAGSITAALFLKRFVSVEAWAHFDIWAWRLSKYGRPAGGAATGLRAAWAMTQARYA